MSVQSRVSGPLPRPTATGIVHLGIGAFARAHPIHFTEMAAELTGDTSWGVLGVTGRRPDAAKALAAQGGRYGVLFRSADMTSLRWVGSLTGVAAVQETDRVAETIASAATSVVTLTITEKGYAPDSAPIRLLTEGLRRRHEFGGRPLTLLSCDNLLANGRRLRAVVRAAMELTGAPPTLLRWLERDVSAPNSMVDRITPETTPGDRAVAHSLSGRHDAALVVAEPFGQWVIEDRFAAPRPGWDRAGGEFVDDVGRWESVKLRLLNGTHTLLACAGALAGAETIADALAMPGLRGWAEVWQRDALRSLTDADAGDRGLDAYARTVLERFANPALRHTTRQVARDTSQKIWMRVLRAAHETLCVGSMPAGAAFVLGAWAAFAIREEESGRELDDPCAREIATAVRAGAGRPERVIPALLAVPGVVTDDIAWDRAFLAVAAGNARSLLDPSDATMCAT